MTEVVVIYGKKACPCIAEVLPHIERELKAAGVIVQDLSGLVTQGAYNTTVSASAGTHDGGGVWDVKPSVATDVALGIWRKWGFLMQLRYAIFGLWPKHGHGVLNGCPHLSPAAAKQVEEYKAGRNGLKSAGPILGPKVPVITFQQAIANYKAYGNPVAPAVVAPVPDIPTPVPAPAQAGPLTLSVAQLALAQIHDAGKPNGTYSVYKAQVGVLQDLLVKTRWLSRIADRGHYGSMTVDAVKGFQAKHSPGLRPSGRLGILELTLLVRLAGAKNPVTK